MFQQGVSSSLMGQKNIVIRMLNAVLANLHADGELCVAFELYVSEGDDQYTDWPAWSDIEHFYNCKVQVN